MPSAPQPYVPPSRPVPQQSTPRPAPAPAYRPASNDTCGAAALQYLVGKPRTEIPVPLQPSQRRVVCSTCVTTQEFRADRQTIVFDSDTGLITSVKCS
ncbi:proteinase inhibitor i78 [Asticcacaulis solisilvae]|uniref:proteinase inhibitor i78 n=1 Tax=Asticcacaulis solisilvae TaxID=1217274 RepID=UPI003FD7BBF4